MMVGMQLTLDQLVHILRFEADKEEYVFCHCQLYSGH